MHAWPTWPLYVEDRNNCASCVYQEQGERRGAPGIFLLIGCQGPPLPKPPWRGALRALNMFLARSGFSSIFLGFLGRSLPAFLTCNPRAHSCQNQDCINQL